MERRAHLRYEIGPEEGVRCRLNRCEPEDRWRPVLVDNESFSGCSLILGDRVDIEQGETISLDFGLGYLSDAEVVHVERLSATAVRLGCRFIA